MQYLSGLYHPTQVQYLYAMAAWYNNLKLTLTGTVRGCLLHYPMHRRGGKAVLLHMLRLEGLSMPDSLALEQAIMWHAHLMWGCLTIAADPQPASTQHAFRRDSVRKAAQLLGVPVATASFTLSSSAPTMLVLPPSFGKVELVYMSASGGFPAYQYIPKGMVRA